MTRRLFARLALVAALIGLAAWPSVGEEKRSKKPKQAQTSIASAGPLIGSSVVSRDTVSTDPGGKLRVSDVIALTRAGVSERIVTTQIERTFSTFQLSVRDLIDLKEAGVPDDVVVEMQDSSRHRYPSFPPPLPSATTPAPVMSPPTSAYTPAPSMAPPTTLYPQSCPLPSSYGAPEPSSHSLVRAWQRDCGPFTLVVKATADRLTLRIDNEGDGMAVTQALHADYAMTKDGLVLGVVTDLECKITGPEGSEVPKEIAGIRKAIVGQPFAFRIRKEDDGILVQDFRCALGSEGKEVCAMVEGRYAPADGKPVKSRGWLINVHSCDPNVRMEQLLRGSATLREATVQPGAIPASSYSLPPATIVPAAPVVPLSPGTLPPTTTPSGPVGKSMLQQSWNQVWNESYAPLPVPAAVRVELAPMPRPAEAFFGVYPGLFGGS